MTTRGRAALPSLGLLLFLSTVAAAAPPGSSPVGDEVDHALAPGLWEQAAPRGTYAQIGVPILSSPEMERRCGKPRLTVVADGSYVMTYRNPKDAGEYLTIAGTRRQIPVVKGATGKPAKDGTLELMGQRFAYYFSGSEDPEIMTQGMSLKAPDGRTGNYVVTFGGKRSGKGKVPALAWQKTP